MKRNKRKITILAIGDRADYDSYKKLNKEKRFIVEQGFDYKTVHYKQFLEGRIPEIDTEKVIIFAFFPFAYWDKYIEHRHYRGIYGNHTFYKKFNRFCQRIVDITKTLLPDKEIFFVNNPLLSSFYRDKMVVMDALSKNGVTVPQMFRTRRIRDINSLLENGHKLFIKPRCGSMGKGITFLQLGDWQTNFKFRNNKIISKKSDYGWRFREITGNTAFLRKLLKKDVFMEEAIDPMNMRGDRVDFRVYTFLDKVLYVYPRRNAIDEVTTNISQGGRGDPSLLDFIPEKLVKKIKRMALKATKELKLDFTGIDIIVDNNLKNVYVVDVNMFPGFPKRKTFNLSRNMIIELKRLTKNGASRFEKPS
ncbi:MAG: RimK family alpha-L-glutamate ligase [Candidatus Omnitrophota bacterium]